MSDTEEIQARAKIKNFRILWDGKQPDETADFVLANRNEIAKALGWLSTDQLAIRDAETTRRALEIAVEVIDTYSEYDSAMCCDGKECGCQGSSVHQTIQHYIRALQPAPTGWKLVPEGVLRKAIACLQTLAGDAASEMRSDVSNFCNSNADELHRAMIGSVK